MMDKQNLMDQEAAVQLYSALCGEKDLMEVLADMQIQQGIPAEKAEEKKSNLTPQVLKLVVKKR